MKLSEAIRLGAAQGVPDPVDCLTREEMADLVEEWERETVLSTAEEPETVPVP